MILWLGDSRVFGEQKWFSLFAFFYLIWILNWLFLNEIFVTQTVRYPFDWRTPVGYLFAWIAQCMAVFGVMNTVPIFNMIFGSSWLFYVMTGDIINDVAAFNATLKIEKFDGDRAELIGRFLKIIRYYSDAKQWASLSFINLLWFDFQTVKNFVHWLCRCVNGFNKMNRYPLFALFFWNMLATSTLLVTIQFQLVEYSAYNNFRGKKSNYVNSKSLRSLTCQ